MRNFILLGGFVCGIVSCNQGEFKDKAAETLADSTVQTPDSKTNIPKQIDLPKRPFLKTADIKYKVNDVAKSTYNIESICNAQGGFVTSSNLESVMQYKQISQVSEDSSMEAVTYAVSNSIVLRVPNIKLDTVLKDITAGVEYLDSRVLKADDVSLQILANQLTQKRLGDNKARLATAIDNNNKKIMETTVAEDVLNVKQEQADKSKIENLSLIDRIDYSTINLSIYQNDVTKTITFAHQKPVREYHPSFLKKLGANLQFGWSTLTEIVLFLIQFWAFILAGLLFWLLYKRYAKSRVAVHR